MTAYTGPGRLLAHALPALVLVLGACGPSAEEREAALDAAESQVLPVVEANLDSVEAVLDEQPGLIASTRGELREYLNPEQVAMARQLGVEPVEDTAHIARLVRQGALVVLEDSTRYWQVRELTHSLPYVTPATHTMLVELGQRFHARLDSLGLPPFRFEISSVLRTAQLQASLRQGNPNASRTTSSHEFGTTVDVAYNSFAPPADLALMEHGDVVRQVSLEPPLRERLVDRVRQYVTGEVTALGEDHAAALKGVLGEVLREMQDDGWVRALVERAQPVYHMTVAPNAAEDPRVTAG